MARHTWIQDPVTHKLIPAEEWRGPSASTSAYIVPDIQPYRSMINGEIIQSRSHHRAHLAQHGCFEIGNEIGAAMKRPEPKVDRKALKQDIINAVNSVMG